MLLLDADPRLRMVLPPDTAKICEAILRGCDAVPSWQIDMMRARWTHRLYHLTEAVTGRGQVLWFGLRKRWLADQVDAAIGNGVRQLLVVGAGLDPLAARLAHHDPTLLAVETDTAATGAAKRAGLKAANLAGSNLRVVDADFEHERLAEVLASTSWSRDAKSVIIAEGLLMYLTPDKVERFFSDLYETVGSGSILLCTSVYADAHGRPRVAAGWLDRPIRLALRLAGEPMHLGLNPEDASEFFSRQHAKVVEQPTIDDLRARILRPIGLNEEPVTAYEHLVTVKLRH